MVKGILLALVYVGAAVLGGSLLAWLLAPLLDYPYVKVLSRAILLCAALGLLPLWRYAGLTSRGIGLLPVPWSILPSAWSIAILMVLPPMLVFFVTGFRVWHTIVDVFSLGFLAEVAVIFVSSWIVGIFEETLFRGVFFTILWQRVNAMFAVFVTSICYAAVHFLEPSEDISGFAENFTGGLWYVLSAFGDLFNSQHLDSFAALFLLGCLLCIVRTRWGLWAAIAMHAAWVFGIRVFKELTVRDVVNPFRELVGEFDNFVGVLVAFWLAFALVSLALARRLPGRSEPLILKPQD